MSLNINSNFPSMSPSSTQEAARHQQIQKLTNKVKKNEDKIKKNEDKIAKIDKEIIAREKIIDAAEKIIDAAETKKATCIEIMQNCQKGIKVCEESKDIIKKMIGIYETLIARNEASKAYSKASNYSIQNKPYTTPYDKKYEKAFQKAMDTSWTVESLKGYKKPESIDFLNYINNTPKAKNYIFSMFTEWFNGFKSYSAPFFRLF